MNILFFYVILLLILVKGGFALKKRLYKRIFAACFAVLTAVQLSSVSSVAMFGSSLKDTDDIKIVINTNKSRKNISRYIYGLNANDKMSGVTVYNTKQSGAALSSYNWETNYANLAAEGGYDNTASIVGSYPQSAMGTPALLADRLNKISQKYDIDSRYITLQMMGFVANDSRGSVMPDDSSKRWSRVSFNKGDSLLVLPDVYDEYVYMDEYVSYLVNTYGYAYQGGINGYFLDREPERWDINYGVLGLEPITSAELVERSSVLANTIKRIDRSALVYGPSINGIESYANLCNLEDWEQYRNNYSWFIDYYLDSMKKASDAAGVRLLDVLDLHFISEAKSVILEPIITSDSKFANQERMQAVRVLWDSSYTENSETANLYKQHTPIIPTVQASIRMYYPGTKLSFSEYNFGGENHISGGIAQADVLGIFGEQEVYMACLLPGSGSYVYQKSGINIYTNYDGEGSSFGDVSVYSDNGGDHMSSVHAAVSENDDSRLTAVLINKNEYEDKAAEITIKSDVEFSGAKVYGFNSESPDIVLMDTIDDIKDNAFTFVMEPLTVYLLEFDGREVLEEDPDTETSVETTSETTAPEPEHVSGEFPIENTSSQTTPPVTDTITSVSVVTVDTDGETITEIVTETVIVDPPTETSAESTAAPDAGEENESGVPRAVKAAAIILLAAVLAIMLVILYENFKRNSKSER